jgi:hypothetical protein
MLDFWGLERRFHRRKIIAGAAEVEEGLQMMQPCFYSLDIFEAAYHQLRIYNFL